MKKLKSKKGFTLMEMLIVVAIIGILIAIAIPVFSAQLTSAQTAVTNANERSAKSMAVVQYMLDEQGAGGAGTYYALIDPNDNMTVTSALPTIAGGATAGSTFYTITMSAAGAVSGVAGPAPVA